MKNLAFKKIKGFTLIEGLCSLLLLGLICLLFQTAVRQLHFLQKFTFSSKEEDFQVFLLQLEYEMKDLTFIEIQKDRLVFQDEEGLPCTFYKNGSTVIKSLKGGYQPLLMTVADFKVSGNHEGCLVEVTFINEKNYRGYLPF